MIFILTGGLDIDYDPSSLDCKVTMEHDDHDYTVTVAVDDLRRVVAAFDCEGQRE